MSKNVKTKARLDATPEAVEAAKAAYDDIMDHKGEALTTFCFNETWIPISRREYNALKAFRNTIMYGTPDDK